MKSAPKISAVVQKMWGSGIQAGSSMMFWPLIALGARLVFRVIMNTWNMIED